MNILTYQYATLTLNAPVFRFSRNIQNLKLSLLDYTNRRFYPCMSQAHKNPIFVWHTDYSCRQFALAVRCKNQNNSTISVSLENGGYDACALEKSYSLEKVHQETPEKNFWGAVGLIVGTAVGPGMLGLPAATLKSELSFAVMKQDSVAEVSFTGLARKTLGSSLELLTMLGYMPIVFFLASSLR
ncbi:uncharacterized protein [Coffea arabica]|uniref:Uncharacterized protein isoform X2 n=1 Tax=Coffea arabica TaxID=13443 RepID=A0ABM4UQE8_COFAR